jgi:hypothetical protein
MSGLNRDGQPFGDQTAAKYQASRRVRSSQATTASPSHVFSSRLALLVTDMVLCPVNWMTGALVPR